MPSLAYLPGVEPLNLLGLAIVHSPPFKGLREVCVCDDFGTLTPVEPIGQLYAFVADGLQGH